MDKKCSRMGQKTGLKSVAYFLFLCTAYWLLVTGAQSAVRREKEASDLLHQLSNSFESLAQRVSPAVVQVLVTGYGPLEEESGQTNTGLVVKQRSLGSGVIVDPNGYIMTNAHVVEGAQRVRVALAPVSPRANESSGGSILDESIPSTVNAIIVGVDKETDLALLKIEATGLPTLRLGDSRKLRQGQLVLAFGSPLGLANSVTLGVISSGAPRQLQPDRPMVYIQTDAPINPGNSGGPLVDVDGNVVGISTFILSQSGGNEGLGFAVPSHTVEIIYQQLRKYGHVHRGEIGVSVQNITPVLTAGLGLPASQGVMVADVLPDGPAEAAGLQIQDIVLKMDGRRG